MITEPKVSDVLRKAGDICGRLLHWPGKEDYQEAAAVLKIIDEKGIPLAEKLEQENARLTAQIEELKNSLEISRTQTKDAYERVSIERGENAKLLRCTAGHVHNQEYGKRCPICERNELQKRLEEAEKDTERLVWYTEHYVSMKVDQTGGYLLHFYKTDRLIGPYPTWRGAIDAAREVKK